MYYFLLIYPSGCSANSKEFLKSLVSCLVMEVKNLESAMSAESPFTITGHYSCDYEEFNIPLRSKTVSPQRLTALCSSWNVSFAITESLSNELKFRNSSAEQKF